ncbi:MAG: hypothetical protein WDW36_004729 [Sanguina aurantia]
MPPACTSHKQGRTVPVRFASGASRRARPALHRASDPGRPPPPQWLQQRAEGAGGLPAASPSPSPAGPPKAGHAGLPPPPALTAASRGAPADAELAQELRGPPKPPPPFFMPNIFPQQPPPGQVPPPPPSQQQQQAPPLTQQQQMQEQQGRGQEKQQMPQQQQQQNPREGEISGEMFEMMKMHEQMGLLPPPPDMLGMMGGGMPFPFPPPGMLPPPPPPHFF